MISIEEAAKKLQKQVPLIIKDLRRDIGAIIGPMSMMQPDVQYFKQVELITTSSTEYTKEDKREVKKDMADAMHVLKGMPPAFLVVAFKAIQEEEKQTAHFAGLIQQM